MLTKYIRKKNIFFNKYFFYYISVFFLFIFIFWCFFYNNNGIIIANQKIVCFLISYLLEILLSIDNVFVWFCIFQSFNIPILYQKKILLYGILGSVVLRITFICFGNIFFEKWHWLLYLFSIFFIFTSLKTIFFSSSQNHLKINITYSWLYKIFRVINKIDKEKFFLKIDNKFFVTPLFICLIVIELSDIIFAIDSIPAIFSITDDILIIFTSNIFAILGLRRIYWLIACIIEKFPEIKYAVSLVLVFLGIKILIEQFLIISAFFTLSVILIIMIIAYLINIVMRYK